MPRSKKLYVIVRGNLSPAQQAVQACHAVDVFRQQVRTDVLEILPIALLVVEDEKKLVYLSKNLHIRNIDHSLFIEDDGTATATACATDENQLFKNLKKLGE